MSNWERREINNLIPEKPEDYKRRFPKPFSSMIPADAGPDNKLATEAYVRSHSGGGGEGGSVTDAVKYTSQSLTDDQKSQARANIGAGTYSKPTNGIPASDLASGVIPDVSGKEDTSNKVTSLSAQSTDTQYPSAKAVVDYVDEHGGIPANVPVFEDSGPVDGVVDPSEYATQGEVDALDARVDALEAGGGNRSVLASSYYPPKGMYQQTFGRKKLAQLTQLQYTPKGSIPTPNNGSVSTPQEGLIYSETQEIDKFVGYDVSIHTFMTAVNNPYSVLYTENISRAYSRSAYGIVYKGSNLAGAYYGSVCNTFAAMGSSPVVHPVTAEMFGGRTPLFIKNYDQSIRGCRMMDLVGKSGHVLVVSNLVVDQDGIVTQVEISEANGARAVVRGTYDEAQFASFLSTNQYVVGRLLTLETNIEYKPSPFVAVGEEVISTPFQYNDDICTMYGDKPCLKEDDILHINYTKGNYTSMKVYKNDSLIDTIALSNDSSVHDVNLTGNNYGYGKFKACLTDGANDSDFTYWEIIDASLNFLDQETITYHSANGKALYWEWCDEEGNSWIQTLISDQERTAGKTIVGTSPNNTFIKLKVHFEGEYGRVSIYASEPIPTAGAKLALVSDWYSVPSGAIVLIEPVGSGHSGLIYGDINYAISPFIAVTPGSQIKLVFGITNTYVVAQMYTDDEEDAFVAGDSSFVNRSSPRIVTLAANCTYIRMTVKNEKGQGYGVYDANDNPLWTW